MTIDKIRTPRNVQPQGQWTIAEMLGFARFFFMRGEDRLDALTGHRPI